MGQREAGDVEGKDSYGSAEERSVSDPADELEWGGGYLAAEGLWQVERRNDSKHKAWATGSMEVGLMV